MIPPLPYPGLRPFEQHEADIFFGREEQTDELLRRLDTTHFLAVIGPSGCGKSSLVRAGMMAALETGFMAGAGPRWRMAVMRPGSHPLDNLAAALIEESALGPERSGMPDAVPFLAATLRRGPLGLLEALRETPLPDHTNLLVLVDQFEELFRFQQEDQTFAADAFVSLLLESAAQRHAPIYVVITMRSDYIGDCVAFTGLPEALNRSQYLTPRLTREQLRAAIEGPARVYGGDVEAALANKLLNEAGRDPDQLPVLQHLLMRMWTYQQKPADSCIPGAAVEVPPQETKWEPAGRLLTLKDYEAVGGFELALSNHADEAYEQALKQKLAERGQRIAEVLFRRICEGGAGRRDARRPTAVSKVAQLANVAVGGVNNEEIIEVANVFREPQYGFLVPACPEPLKPDKVLDITHESLIRQWKRLNEWAKKEAESAGTYRLLEETARNWETKKAGLWRHPELDVALGWKKREKPTGEWAARYGGDFKLALRFLNKSRNARVEKLLGIVGAIIAILVIVNWVRERERQQSFSRELAAAAVADLTSDPERSVWLALHAVSTSPTEEAQDALQRAFHTSRVRGTLRDPDGTGSVRAVAFSKDGELIATGGEDGITRIWDASSGDLRDRWTDHGENSLVPGFKAITGVAFSPTADILVTAGDDGALHLRDLASRKHVVVPEAHEEGVKAVSFSGDGTVLATLGQGKKETITFWEVTREGLASINSISAGKAGWNSVTFDPKRTRLAAVTQNGHVLIVDYGQDSSGKDASEGWMFQGYFTRLEGTLFNFLSSIAVQPYPLLPHLDKITSISFSPLGNLLATGSTDRTAKLWATEKPKEGDEDSRDAVLTLTGHANAVTRVVFSPDGSRLATTSDDMTVKIWDVRSGQELMTLAGHSSTVEDLAFSPNGESLVTASDDGTAIIWDVSPGHTDQVYDLAFSPNGKSLASVGRDGTVKVWEVTAADLKPAKSFPGHWDAEYSVEFSPDGKRLATGGADDRAIVWDLESGKKHYDSNHSNYPHSGEVRAVAFSPKGDVLATASMDKTVSLRDPNSEIEKHRFPFPESVVSIAFDRDGTLLAVATQHEVSLWDAITFKERSLPAHPKHDRGILAVTFSPDGTLLATAGWDQQAKVWNAATGGLIRSLPHSTVVTDVKFSHNGKWLATASWDRMVRIWDTSNWKLLHTFAHNAAVNAVEFSPDDRYLGTACDDKGVYVLPLDLEELRKVARTRLTHAPTPEECKRYLQTAACPPTP